MQQAQTKVNLKSTQLNAKNSNVPLDEKKITCSTTGNEKEHQVLKEKKNSKVNWIKILTISGKVVFMLGGIIAGTKILNYFEDIPNKKQIGENQLDYVPNYFQYDPIVYKIFYPLNQWRKYSKDNYERCLECTDILLRIRQKFVDSLKNTPDIQEIPRAEHIYSMARVYLDAFYENILEIAPQQKISPQKMVLLENHIENLTQYLNLTLISIFNLTSCI